MAFKKGISGNPGGKSREKIFTDALRLELNRVDPQDKDKRKKITLRGYVRDAELFKDHAGAGLL